MFPLFYFSVLMLPTNGHKTWWLHVQRDKMLLDIIFMTDCVQVLVTRAQVAQWKCQISDTYDWEPCSLSLGWTWSRKIQLLSHTSMIPSSQLSIFAFNWTLSEQSISSSSDIGHIYTICLKRQTVTECCSITLHLAWKISQRQNSHVPYKTKRVRCHLIEQFIWSLLNCCNHSNQWWVYL